MPAEVIELDVNWKGKKAALTLSFDDAYKSTFDSTVNFLAEKGIRATYNVIVAYLGKPFGGIPTASLDDWITAARDYCMEIASHSYSHRMSRHAIEPLPALSKRLYPLPINLPRRIRAMLRYNKSGLDFQREVLESKRALEQMISYHPILTFVYPGGTVYTKWLKDVVRAAGYLSARSSRDGYNLPSSMDRFELKTKTWSIRTPVKQANDWLDEAVRQGAWLIETHHLVDHKNALGYPAFTHVSEFEEHVEYALSKDIWIDTQQNIMKHLLKHLANKVLNESGQLIC